MIHYLFIAIKQLIIIGSVDEVRSVVCIITTVYITNCSAADLKLQSKSLCSS
jgi:hypothetical protein